MFYLYSKLCFIYFVLLVICINFVRKILSLVNYRLIQAAMSMR